MTETTLTIERPDWLVPGEPDRVDADPATWTAAVAALAGDPEAHHVETDRAAYATLRRLVAEHPDLPVADQARAVLEQADVADAERCWWYS